VRDLVFILLIVNTLSERSLIMHIHTLVFLNIALFAYAIGY
jgi:hypothetical protein